MNVGIRELKQNASAVIQKVARHGRVVVTDRGRPVAQISPLTSSVISDLCEAGLARPARNMLADLPAPPSGPSLTDALTAMRGAERY
ncbi:MAG: type II toxin-antitoxin system prevent-host-death family antitoxin [Cellulomonadaceae bacterium]|jgi:prevent-host-death family protein|nr:type II toxin-antitoxin system prevent-host-death family antitoxin [Cellulomonadaceae bacterium]